MSVEVYIDSEVGVKKTPSSLQILCLNRICQALLKNWELKEIYSEFSSNAAIEDFQNQVFSIIPVSLYENLFELMVGTHARSIENISSDSDYYLPGVSALLNVFISPKLKKLSLQCLRHMGVATDEEMSYFHSVLSDRLPNLTYLVELSLQTSGTDFTLPVCSDDILKGIGSACFNLENLDISFNHTVTDNGLYYLLPSNTLKGCPKLVIFSLFECSVTHMGIVMLLEKLPKLKFLGYKETGECLRVFNNRNCSDSVKLRLAHINNLGTKSRTCKDLYELECNISLINSVCKFCPQINALKVRVNDSLVKLLPKITNIRIIHLFYNLGVPSSPGNNTIQYLELCGSQFVSLAFVCDNFNFKHLTAVCEQCCNLKSLLIKCNSFSIERNVTTLDKQRCVLTNLEECVFKVGDPRDDYQFNNVPFTVFDYILHKSNALTEIELAVKSSHICDFNVEKLFSSIKTSTIRKVLISVPHKIVRHSLDLSTMTAVALVKLCPELLKLGNLLVWEMCKPEILELERQLHQSNSALVLIYK